MLIANFPMSNATRVGTIEHHGHILLKIMLKSTGSVLPQGYVVASVGFWPEKAIHLSGCVPYMLSAFSRSVMLQENSKATVIKLLSPQPLDCISIEI